MHKNHRRKNISKNKPWHKYWTNRFKSANREVRRAEAKIHMEKGKYDLLDSFENAWRRGLDRWSYD